MASTPLPRSRPTTLSVVVPCYNEEAGLAELYARLSKACSRAVGSDYEIVLVDDGSRDGTWAGIRHLAAADIRVVGVSLSRNHGHQLALSAGLSASQGARILIIDADLQDPPELLIDMMRLMDEGADVVYGQRISRAGETWYKRTTASIFYRLLRSMTALPIPLDTGDFRLISRRVLDVLQAMPEQHRFIRGMISWIGFTQVPLRYHRAQRFAGETKYPLHRMIRFAIDAMTGFSIQPLRLGAYIGLFLGACSMALLVYTLASWLFWDAVHGWTSLMSVILMLGSAQMLFLGVLGEYIGRLYVESKHRPLFVIAEVLRSPESLRESAEMPGKQGLVAARTLRSAI